MATFDQFKELTKSEKVALVWLHPTKRQVTDWDNTNAPIYTFNSTHFVNDVLEDGTSLAQAANSSLSSGEWFFDKNTKVLYVRTTGDVDPGLVFTTLEFRLFFSNRPTILPFDLDTGRDVEYEPRLDDISDFSHEIDNDDLSGIALTGTGNITLINKDDFFDSIYEKFFWETSEVQVYTWSPIIPKTAAKLVYRGQVANKSYRKNIVRFRLKDFVEQLRDEVPLSLYTENTGTFSESVIGRPKRRIYGQVKGLRVQSLDQTLDGFELAGTFTGNAGSSTITGVGSDLLDELSPEDEVFFTNDELEDITFKVEAIISNTSFTVSEEIEEAFSGITLKNNPERPYRRRNRNYLVAGHLLREPATTITSVVQINRFFVGDTTDLDADDLIFIGSTRKQIRRISGNEIILNTALPTIPSVGTTVKKSAIQDVFIGPTKLVLNRDYTIQNSSGDSKIVLENDAEFNVARPVSLQGNLTFTQSSRTVSGAGTNFLEAIRPRDWIKPDLTAVWYEVLSVGTDTSLTLRVAFIDVSTTNTSQVRRPNYVSDDTIVTVEALGKTKDGSASGIWLRTGAHAVEDLLIEAGLTSQLNTASFTEAKLDANFTLSLAIPRDFDTKSRPEIKKVITDINQSIFGALFNDNNLKISYGILSPKKPTITEIIRTDDLIDFDIQSEGKNIVKSIAGKFQHFDAGRFNGEDGAQVIEHTNENVANLSSIKRTEEIDFFLFKRSEAKIMAQRVGLLRSVSNGILSLETKLKFIDSNINQVVYFELDRLPERLGTISDKTRIGVITAVTKGIFGTKIEVADLGSMYNRVCTITKDTATIYSNATKVDRANHGFITDAKGVIDDIDITFGINVIG